MSHAPLTAEIEDWLVAKALADPDIVLLFERLADRLHALGIPLGRAVLSWPTLHPLFRAEHVFWRVGEGAVLERSYHSADGPSEEFLKSPFHYAQQRELRHLRRRLEGPSATLDFEVLEDLAGQGFTDYLLTATRFGIASVPNFGTATTGLMASWSTRRPGGFSDDDLEALKRIQTVMAVACRAAIQLRVMTNVGEAYLGPTAGRRVLAGDIRRGDGEHISAVVWFSDLRGSTRLSDAMDADSYLALLNRYFECTAQPVIDGGGEVLNFIGDGVLAIFPVEDGCPREAARRAEAAADESLRLWARANREGPAFRYGIGLALGDVMFGNIGVPGRLAFSAVGRVVNQVQRVEKATERLRRTVLATGAFAEIASGAWEPAGELAAGEFAEGVPLFCRATPDREADRRDGEVKAAE